MQWVPSSKAKNLQRRRTDERLSYQKNSVTTADDPAIGGGGDTVCEHILFTSLLS